MDACQFFLLRYERGHQLVTEMLLTEVTDSQIRTRPVDGVNTIAWNVWHMARTEDLGLSRFIGRREQLFFEGGWGERLNVPETDIGTGMTAAEVTELSARIDLGGLRTYWAEVARRTRSIISNVRPEDLDAVNDSAYILEVVEKDGVFREAGRWTEGFWADLPDRSKGYFLAYLGLTHNWVHYSEAMVTRSLMGLPGR
jgi:DinB superfamily